MADKLSIILGDEEIDLGTNKQDRLAFVVRAISGLSPFGSMMAETILKIIPDQKQDRLITFVEVLELRLTHLIKDVAEIKQRLQSPEGTDLLEDALGQASRAVSDERLEYIASLFANGLSQGELEHLETKKLLSLLGQTNDPEILILKYHSLMSATDLRDFAKTHRTLFRPIRTRTSRRDIEREALRDAYTANLLRLGLLRATYHKPKNGEFPEFDENTGTLKAHGYEVTRLGKMLLRYIGISG